MSLSSDDRCYVVRNDEAGDIVQVSSPNDSELEVAMITPDQFRTLVASRSIDARIDAHGTIQIPLEELDRFLELTEELGLVILGLDGLRQDGAVIVPLIDYIADFSDVAGPWLDRVRASAAAARAVAADWVGGPDLVEMVLDGLDE